MAASRKYLGAIARTHSTTGTGSVQSTPDHSKPGLVRPEAAEEPESDDEDQGGDDTTPVTATSPEGDNVVPDGAGDDQGDDGQTDEELAQAESQGDGSTDDEPIEHEVLKVPEGNVDVIVDWVNDVDDSDSHQERAQAALDVEVKGKDRSTLTDELEAILARYEDDEDQD